MGFDSPTAYKAALRKYGNFFLALSRVWTLVGIFGKCGR